MRRSKYYVGATRYTSNTDEFTAVIECLLWWTSAAENLKNDNNDEAMQCDVPENVQNSQLGDSISLIVGPIYVVLLLGHCKANEKHLLVDLMLHWWRFVGARSTTKIR